MSHCALNTTRVNVATTDVKTYTTTSSGTPQRTQDQKGDPIQSVHSNSSGSSFQPEAQGALVRTSKVYRHRPSRTFATIRSRPKLLFELSYILSERQKRRSHIIRKLPFWRFPTQSSSFPRLALPRIRLDTFATFNRRDRYTIHPTPPNSTYRTRIDKINIP